MEKWLLILSLLFASFFIIYAKGIKKTARRQAYTAIIQDPLVAKKTIPALTPGVLYTISTEIWDSIGTNAYTLEVMNQGRKCVTGNICCSQGQTPGYLQNAGRHQGRALLY